MWLHDKESEIQLGNQDTGMRNQESENRNQNEKSNIMYIMRG